jgi:peptidoglycan/LPS O-acetylase OafA/YrhL
MPKTFPTPTLPAKGSASYEPALDIVRFFAFFAVFFTHFVNKGGNAIQVDSGQWWNTDLIQRIAAFGGQGVTLFFGLTGFLLGRILIKEFQINGKVSIRMFYIRRALRIWPLYFAFLILCIILNRFANSPTITPKEIPYLLTFSYNWGQIYGDLPGTMATITWSISVEEQIYFIFPILFFLLVKKNAKNLSSLLVILGVFSVLLSLYVLDIPAERFTPAFLLPIGIGLFCAVHEDKIRNARKSKVSTALVLAALLFYVLVFREISTSEELQFCSYLASAFILPCALYISRGIQFNNLSKLNRVLAYVGRRSYGCYLLHWSVWTVMVGKGIGFEKSEGFSILGVVVGMLTTVLISSFSYRYFELPFLRLRKRFQQVESP